MNLTSLLSRFTSHSQKTQCYSKSDKGDCFGTTFYCPKKYGDTCSEFQCTLVGKKASSACMTNQGHQA